MYINELLMYIFIIIFINIRYFYLPPVIVFMAGKMVDRDDLVPAALSQDVLTVFQFYAYIIQHEVQDMETHLLHLAREGE